MDFISGLFQLLYYLFQFIGYITGAVFLLVMIYLLFIRPIIKIVTDKSHRLYWFGLIALVIGGLVGVPFGLFLIEKFLGSTAMWIGLGVVFVFFLVLNHFVTERSSKNI
ncbi:hypothetical protein QUF73_24820 [Cytobacillus sp. NJ13]|nr:hypothetical protein [Cytobacillus sp. NJ13]